MTDKKQKIQKDRQKKQENDDLWNLVTKDVTPLEKKNIAQKDKLKSSPPVKHTTNRYDSNNTYTPAQTKSTETDYRTSQRLKRGKIKIEGRLDLHGKTQIEAYDALLDFIPRSYNQGKRCVLIITGKGNRQDSSTSLLHSKPGILKQRTPEWLTTPPLNAYVLKTETARQTDGGEGALYVLLRRDR
ncbi:MAG: Smr/MutS family protein [Alphaproteobacteria bacterium]